MRLESLLKRLESLEKVGRARGLERVKLRGRRGEVEVLALANSGSHYLVIPKSVAERIEPEPLGIKESFLLATGATATLPFAQ